MFEILHTFSEKDSKKDFVGIGGYYDKDSKLLYHSVLIIQFQQELYVFHYTGDRNYPLFFNQDISDTCFHKITYNVPEILVPSFIAQCQEVLKKATPTYGYFYSGEFYDFNGNHNSNSSSGERMTCAGFCLNVLKGFLMEDYIDFEQWDSSTHKDPDYLENYSIRHSLNIDDIASSHRRISPLDLICSGYFIDLPIQKAQIDSKHLQVSDYLNGFYL
jgi:hypothetical protein